MLPTGEVLLTAFNQGTGADAVGQIVVYSNGVSPLSTYRPIITSAPTTVAGGGTYTITGKQFNGFSYGATYGDDSQSETNYPLVRITNRASGVVSYARTFNFSSMGVQKVGSSTLVTASFQAPPNLPAGASWLEVVANGIASNKQNITAEAGPCPVGTPDTLHFVDQANGTDDVNHGGNYGACGYKTLTYALAHTTGQIALQAGVYSPATEAFPIILKQNQQLLCQYLITAPVTIQGKGFSTDIGNRASVVFEGIQNALVGCNIDGGGGTGYCVDIITSGKNSIEVHGVYDGDIRNCGGTAIKVNEDVSYVSIDGNLIHNSLIGTFWAGNNSAGDMIGNIYSTNTTDVQCGSADLGVIGNGSTVGGSNQGDFAGRVSCVTCGNCPYF